VTPQVWRHCSSTAVEEFVTGTDVWPECADEDLALQKESTLPSWWQEPDFGAAFLEDFFEQKSSGTVTDKGSQQFAGGYVDRLGRVTTERVNLEALGAERRGVRHTRSCAVCARQDWHTEFDEVLFWQQAASAGKECLFKDQLYDVKRKPVLDGRLCGSALEVARHLFSPGRYAGRWRFVRKDGTYGGLPLAELEASCVREPGDGRHLWLLNRKAFCIGSDGKACRDQLVPLCKDCHGSLKFAVPKMPKFALANDLWVGKLPAALHGLSEGAWLLLPLARAFIKRINCLCDSGKFLPTCERIRGFVGNACVFPQADGGRVLLSLPPKKGDVLERLLIAFTGTDNDLKKAYFKELGVDAKAFQDAYEFLRRYNCVYGNVQWDSEAARDLDPEPGCGGLPKVLAACVRLQDPAQDGADLQVRQSGADEAVERCEEDGSDAESQVEEGEFVVGCGETDVQVDSEKQ